MSVINKMLRDLDSRQLSGGAGIPTQEISRGVLRGTTSVQDRSLVPMRGPITPRFLRWLAALLLLAAAGAAGWYLQVVPNLQSRPDRGAGAAAGPAASASAPAASAAVMAPLAASTASAPMPQPVASVDVGTAVMPEPPAPALEVAKTPLAKVAGASRSPSVATPAAAVKPAKVAVLASPQPLPAASTPPAAVAALPLTIQRQTAAQETLAQAQSLWVSGSREAALELLREAVAVAERAHSAGSPVLPSLVRELARMELAEGRAQQVLALLTRLEPMLSAQADLWAVRGNAAQRLGLHQDAAQAYLAALKLRPDESRWMLGAAVSLAAQGQLTAAAELVEKARAAGVVSPDILAYLRQLGVPLRER